MYDLRYDKYDISACYVIDKRIKSIRSDQIKTFVVF